MKFLKKIRSLSHKVHLPNGNWSLNEADSALKEQTIAEMKKVVKRMEEGEHVPISDDDYDLLIDYLDMTDHRDANKLASIWVHDKHHLLAFFKYGDRQPLH